MNVKQSPPPKVRHSIQASQLYKIVGKGQLQSRLGINLDFLSQLLAPENYRVWINQKGREIQQPIYRLGQLHKRIANLMSRIVLPDYVYSQKGRSYIDNARQHIGSQPLGKTDIHKFYPSTSRQMVWRMFHEDFKCAKDISNILADLCCYQQKHLPTGSPLSGHVAFFASREMFDEIEDVARMSHNKMTLYVDDVTMSGSTVTKNLMYRVRSVIHRHGLKAKKSKTKTFAAHSPKTVTGAVIVGSEVRLPNQRHKKIWETRRFLKASSGAEKKRLLRSLKGRLQESKQITKAE